MTEEEEDKVLSDVHVFTHHEEVDGADSQKRVVSRFIFTLPKSEETDSDCNKILKECRGQQTDSDDDLIVERKQCSESTQVLTIYHNLETVLADVGLQIWSGCLLLCDYMIYNSIEFRNKTILDLGAGCGLTSIVASMFATRVYCTDYSDGILDLARENIELNSHLIPGVVNTIEVRRVDWMNWVGEKNEDSLSMTDSSQVDIITAAEVGEKNEDSLSMTDSSQVDIITAAEVIYDIDLTTALFNTLTHLLKSSSKTIYISLEKRCNFCLKDLGVASPAYSHFRECLDILQSNLQSEDCQLEYNQVITDFAQYFKYSRLKELELWKITSKKTYPKR